MTIEFFIPGEPRGKQRPRVAVRGQYAHAYTPEQTTVYENLVKMMYLQQCAGQYLKGAIKAEIVAYFPIPKSVSKKKRGQMLSGEVKHTKKPDGDNIAKIVLDSLNGIAFDDDSQVCDQCVKKRYNVEVGVYVQLTEI